MTFKLGIEMFFLRVADAQVRYKRPGRWYVERCDDFHGIENRDPSDAKAVGACREPKDLDRCDR
jgi:hypothetical protein